MCVWPANTAACYPGFYTTAASLGSLAGQVSKEWPQITYLVNLTKFAALQVVLCSVFRETT
jgi:hypothetical protein